MSAVLLALTLCARAEEPPLAPGVTAELRAERTEFALGDPILVDLTYKNDGQEKWQVVVPLVCGFYNDFEARDAKGARVPNPFGDVEYGGYDGTIDIHDLPPGGTVTVRKFVNSSVAFEKPGATSRRRRFPTLETPCARSSGKRRGGADHRRAP
jgi:hypothetical protein